MAITQGQNANASDFVSTSSGASDEGKVAKLNASGQIPDGFLSTKPLNVQTFTTAGANTWTKPSQGTIAHVRLWAGGGSGARSSSAGANCVGGAGGEYKEFWKLLSELGATETVTVAAGGAAVSSNAAGNAGGDTTFGSHGTAHGGAGGGVPSGGTVNGSAGGSSIGLGSPLYGPAGSGSNLISGLYSAGSGTMAGGGGTAQTAGSSVYGGAAGGGVNSVGTIGAAGTSEYGGNGGAASKTGNATAGAQPGGGGGGVNAGAYNSGKGGDGKCIVTVF